MTRPLALLPTQFPRFLLGIDHVCVSITRIIFIRVNTNIDRVKNVLETRKCPPLKLINFINFNALLLATIEDYRHESINSHRWNTFFNDRYERLYARKRSIV